MARVADLSVDLKTNSAKFNAGLRSADRALNTSAAKWGRTTKKMERGFYQLRTSVESVTRGFGALAAVAGIGSLSAALSSAATKAAIFGEAMAEVSTLLSDKTQIAGLRSEVLRLSAAFGSDAVTQAKALYQVISAGASDAKQAIDILTTANKLAKGGVTDVTTAADGLTSAMNAYDGQVKSATDASDAFFVAVKAGKTTIRELSASIGSVAKIASQSGVGLEELLAATATLTKGGVSTSVAMNGLKQVISGVVKPTEEAKKLAAELGLQFDATALKTKGLAGFLKDVGVKTKGSTQQLAKLFNLEALGPVLALTGGQAKDFADIIEDMGNKAGETEKALATIADTPIESFRKLRAEGEATMIGIGDVILTELQPAIDGLIPRLQILREAFHFTFDQESQLLALDSDIKKIQARLDELRSDKIPDWLQFADIDIAKKRLQDLRDEYNQLADAVYRARARSEIAAASAASSGPTNITPDIIDDTGGDDAPSLAMEKLAQKTSDAKFELQLLEGGYSDAEKEALRFARTQGLLNNALGDIGISADALAKYDDYAAALERLDSAQRRNAEEAARHKKIQSDAKQVFESTRTEAELYALELDRIKALLDNGAISQDTYNRAVKNLSPEFQLIQQSGEKAFDAIGEAAMNNFQDMGDIARRVIREIINDMYMMAAINPLKNALLGTNAPTLSGIGGVIGGLFSGGGSAAMGGGGSYVIAAPGGSFAGGGYTGDAPRVGGLDGQGGFLAMMHPQETVIDHAQGQSMGGGTYYIDARGADREGLARVEAQIRALNGSIEHRAVAAVSSGNKRGGGSRRSLG